jgi:hypothetical protein
MVNWKKLAKSIPTEIQVTPRIRYSIVWVETSEENADWAGKMDDEKKIIFIKLGQANKDKVLTYLHEVLHAFSDENKIGLTEKQVTALENKMMYYWLKNGNLFLL